MTNATMLQLAMFCQRVLAYAPIRSLSLSSKIRNTRAAGRSVTATTWTKMVIVFCTSTEATRDTNPAASSIATYAT